MSQEPRSRYGHDHPDQVFEDTGSESKGETLFQELFRHFPIGKYEDYYTNRRWDIEKLEVDLELITAHRKEAGAPEPPPLEEMDMPELPTSRMTPTRPSARTLAARPRTPPVDRTGSAHRPMPTDGRGSHAPMATRAPGLRGAVSESSRSSADAARATGRTFQSERTRPSAPGRASPPRGPPPSSRARDIGDKSFADRWRMDPNKSQELLRRLTSIQKDYVMRNFSTSGATNGIDSLTTYIDRRPWVGRVTDRDDAPTGSRPSSGIPVSLDWQKKPLNGQKRPLSNPSQPDAKRARPAPAPAPGRFAKRVQPDAEPPARGSAGFARGSAGRPGPSAAAAGPTPPKSAPPPSAYRTSARDAPARPGAARAAGGPMPPRSAPAPGRAPLNPGPRPSPTPAARRPAPSGSANGAPRATSRPSNEGRGSTPALSNPSRPKPAPAARPLEGGTPGSLIKSLLGGLR